MRITAKLIQIRDQTPVWTRQYDRQMSDLLILQGEITQENADDVELTLGVGKPRVLSKQPFLSYRGTGLKTRELLILCNARSARSAKKAQIAEVGYTAGTRPA